MRVQRFVSGLSCSSHEWGPQCMTVVALAAKSAKVLRSTTPPQRMATDPLHVKLMNLIDTHIYKESVCIDP